MEIDLENEDELVKYVDGLKRRLTSDEKPETPTKLREEAQDLVRQLYEKSKEDPSLVGKLRNSNSLIVRGISYTLEYLSLDEEGRKRYTFDEPWAGFGLYEKVITGVHEGDNALWFAEIGGDAEVRKMLSGWGSVYYDNSRASGYEAGWYSKYYDNSEASGYMAGWYSKYYNNSRASGYEAGWCSKYYNNSRASGYEAGRMSRFYNNSQASGEGAGGKSEKPERIAN